MMDWLKQRFLLISDATKTTLTQWYHEIYPDYTTLRLMEVTTEQKIQDDITIVLQAQKIIVHDTVRVNVSIQAQVDPAQSEADFRSEIQKTLHNFIDADWKVQSIQRSKGTSKFESVYVQATARVPERENYQLTDRANLVSRVGFELVGPSVDYSLSFDEVQKINRELRLNLIQSALEECKAINEAFNKIGHLRRHIEYRVSSTKFDNGNNQVSRPLAATAYNMTNVTAAMPMGGAVGNEYGAELEAASAVPVDVNVSTRFSMVGYFTLRQVV